MATKKNEIKQGQDKTSAKPKKPAAVPRKASENTSAAGTKSKQHLDYLASFPEMNTSPVLELDGNGIIKYQNPACKRIFPDLSELGLKHPLLTDWPKIIAAMADASTVQPLIIEANVGRIYFELSCFVVEKKQIRIYCKDMTKNTQAELALRAAEENLKQSLETSPLGMRVMTKAGNNIYANRAVLRLFGYKSVSDFNNIPPENRYTAESYAELNSRRQRRLRGETIQESYELSIIRPDGTIRYLQVYRNEILWNGQLHDEALYVDITARKKAEQALALSEKNLRKLYDNSPLGIRVVNKAGKTLYANRALLNIFKYSSAEEFNATPAKDRQTAQSYTESQVRREKRLRHELVPNGYEISIIRKDGEVRRLQAFRNDVLWEGELQHETLYDDVTDRANMEEALLSSEKKYSALVEESTDGIIILNERVIVFANRKMSELSGYLVKELVGKRFPELFASEYVEMLDAGYKKRHGLKRKGSTDYQLELLTKDGTKVPVETKAQPIGYKDSYTAMVIIRDVSERIHSERMLQTYVDNLRKSNDNSPMAIRIVEPGGISRYANKAALELFGYENEDEFNAIPHQNRYTPESFAESEARWQRSLRGENIPEGYEVSIVRKDGAIRYARVFRNEVIWEGKLQIETLYQDITGQKNIEIALKTSEENFRNSMEHSPLGIRIVSEQGETLYTNRAMLDIYGYASLAEFKTTPSISRYTPKSYVEFQERRDKRVHHQLIQENYEVSIVRKDGTVRHLQVMRKEVFWGGKEEYQTLYLDITERKQLMNQINDLNNILRLISNINQLIVKIDDEAELVQKSCEQFVESRQYQMAWIGFKQPGTYVIVPSAKAGGGLDYLASVRITWDDSEFGRGPTGVAIKTGRPAVMRDILHNPDFAPWRENAVKRGFRSTMAVPLVIHDEIIGGFMLYSSSDEAFQEKEIDLLKELAADMSLGIEKIRSRKEHIRIEQELRQERDRAKTYLDVAGVMMMVVNLEGNIILINRRGAEILGYEAGQIIGKNWISTYLPEENREFITEHYRLVMSEKIKPEERYEGQVLTRNGNPRTIAWDTVLLRDTQSKIIGVLSSGEDITERKAAEAALKASEQNFRNTMDSSFLGIRISDDKNHTLYANKALLEIFGYPNLTELEENPPSERYTPESLKGFQSRQVKLKRGEQMPESVKIDIARKDGSIRHLQTSLKEVLWDGQLRYQTVYNDITEGKQAEDALRASEENFRNSMESSYIGIRIVDKNWQTLYANKQFLNLFGYANLEEIRQNPPDDFYTPEEKERHKQRKEKRLPGEPLEEQMDIEILRKDGDFRHLQVFRKEIFWDGQRQYQILYNDITERIQAEDALKASEQNFRNSIDTSLIGIRIVDKNWRTLYANQQFLTIWGCSNTAEINEMDARGLEEIYTLAEYSRYLQREEKRKHGEPVPNNLDIEIIRKDGAIRHLQTSRKEVFWNGRQEYQILYNDITERIQAEDALKASEQNFRNSLDTSPMGIRIADSQDKTLFVNQAFLAMFGYAHIEEINANPPLSRYTPEAHADFLRRMEMRKGGAPRPENVEISIIRKDGSIRHLRLYTRELFWDGQRQFQNLYTDITENKKAEESLKASEQNFRSTLDNSPMGVRIIDAAWHTLYANQKYLEIHGLQNNAEIDAVTVEDRFTPKEYQRYLERRERVRNGEPEPNKLELEIKRKDGSICRLQIYRTEVLWNGKTEFMLLENDITESKKSEEALKASEENFRNSLEKSPMGVRIVDAQWHTLYSNKVYMDIFGYHNFSEIDADKSEQRLTPAEYQRYLQRRERAARGEPEPEKLEIEITRKDGVVRQIQMTRTMVFWDGKTQFQVLYTDITESKRAEEALKASEDKYATLVEQSTDGIILLNGRNVAFANRRICEMTGYSQQEMLGKLFTDLIDPAYKETLDAGYLKRQSARGVYSKDYELEILTKDGRKIPIESRAQRIEYQDVYTAMVIIRDITERKHAEAALRESEAKYRLIVENSRDIIFTLNPAGRLIYVSPSVKNVLGYEPADLVGQQYISVVHPDDAPTVLESIRQNIFDDIQKPGGIEFRARNAAGEWRWENGNGTVVRDNDGKFISFIGVVRDINERKNAEAALQESESKYRMIVENSRDFIFTLNSAGLFVYVSPAVKNLLGYEPADLTNVAFLSLVHPDDVNAIQTVADQGEADGYQNPKTVEYRFRHASGEWRWHVSRGSAVRDASGTVIDFMGIANDVTERKQIEEALKQSEEKFRLIVENSRDMIFTLDHVGDFEYLSPSITSMLGYSQSELVGKPFMALVHLEDQVYIQEMMENTRASRSDYQYPDMEFRVHNDKDEWRWLFIKTTIMRDIDQNFINMVGVARDITEQKRQEKQKEMTLNVLHLLNQSGVKEKLIQDLLVLFQRYGRFEAVGIRLREGDNYPYYASIGFSEKHLLTENCLCLFDSSGKQLYHPDNQPVLDCMCGDVICRRFDPAKSHFTEGGSFWTNSTSEFVASATSAEQAAKIRDCCKSEGYESVALIPLNANNVTIGLLQFNDLRRDRFTVDVILFFEDLAQSIGIALAQKQAEESLVTSESSYRRLFESAKDGILIINALNGVVTDANPYLTDLLGVSPHELINMVLWEINVFKGIVSSKQDFQELLQKGYVRYEDLPLKTDDGRKISVEFVSNVYEVEHRKVVQCNIRDISERKLAGEEKQRLEEKAQVASRLAAMGEMAAGIAHEINNPLTGVLGYSQMMLSKENVPEDIKGDLKLIADNSRRVAEIVKRLLTFARQAKPVKTLVNLNELVDNTLKLRDYVLKTAGIKVVKEFDPDLPLSVADAGQIQQVFLNLVVNAEQAMKTAHGQGTLTIITEKKENNIRILFKDDGPGITEENQTHLFEPFFTTKAQGEGTGLGLSLSRSIIMEHDGKLIVDSQFGHGATFIVELPILEAMPKAEETIVPAVQAPPLVTRKGKILVVDDEAVVRGVLQRVMTKMGHSVDVLSDAKTAMDKIEAGASYDVILTDVRMPGMSGIEMYSRIVARSSEMKKRIIFITGDVMGTDIKSFLTKNDLSYLAKPFDIDALKTKIDSIMSSF